jgi:hypothetical protein
MVNIFIEIMIDDLLPFVIWRGEMNGDYVYEICRLAKRKRVERAIFFEASFSNSKKELLTP